MAPSPLRRAIVAACLLTAAMAAPAPAAADDVIAGVPRATPISAFDGILAWSSYDDRTARYALVIDRKGKAARAPVADMTRPFDVSLGPDARGRVVALYTRCHSAITACDVYRYDVASGREHKVRAVSSPDADEAWPTQWRDRVAFVRRAKTIVMSGYDHRPDPRGKRGDGVLMACDVPYVRVLKAGASSRRLDRSQCGTTTGMSIRGDRIVQVSDENQGGAGSEGQVRLLRSGGGAARILARAGGGEGGYSPYASASQSASAVWLTRTGNRKPRNFLRIDVRSGRMSEVDPHVPLAGRVARDEHGTFWYLQGHEPDEEGDPSCPQRPVPSQLQPCRLIRASADPFEPARRTLAPRLTLAPAIADGIYGKFTDKLAVTGQLRRDIVSGGRLVGSLPLAGVALELLSGGSSIADVGTPFRATGVTTTSDATGRWSFPLSPPPARARLAVAAGSLGLASPAVMVNVDAVMTLKAAWRTLTGTIVPAQPGRDIVIQRMIDRDPSLGPPWADVAHATLSADGTTFSATVGEAGTYQAATGAGEPTDPGVYPASARR